MSLHTVVRIGAHTVVGAIEVRRVTHTDEVVQRPNAVSTYRVSVNDREIGHVAHRYGDGPWALLAAAAAIVSKHAITAAPAETGT